MLRLVAVVPLLVLAACSSPSPTNTPAIKAAEDKMRAIHDDCEARHRRGELKTLGAVERCAAPRVSAVYAEAGYPYMDLIRFADEARVAGAAMRPHAPRRPVISLR